MKNKEALQYLKNILKEDEPIWEYDEYVKIIEKDLSDVESLLEERNNLLDEIDYLKDDIAMLKGSKEHLASLLDRTEFLLEYERAKNKELEAKIIALTIK